MERAMKISKFDIDALAKIRKNVDVFLATCAYKYSKSETFLLDIAPQDHAGAAPFFLSSEISTLDIDPKSGATFIEDLCSSNFSVNQNYFDYVVCTEVLEHTLQPFKAVENIFSCLKPGGLAFVSTPFNFRIHGPLPDCWRFTEHGLRALFSSNFEIVELNALEDEERSLMPFQYTLVARKSAD